MDDRDRQCQPPATLGAWPELAALFDYAARQLSTTPAALAAALDGDGVATEILREPLTTTTPQHDPLCEASSLLRRRLR